ncbi:MAG TPA: hypothetical protein GXX65_12070 [Methanosarcina sp.]|nr:hypothetical protein [Methanosarcina sp.]
MKLDMKIQWMELKISEMEKMIELKRKAIDNIRKVQQTLKKSNCGRPPHLKRWGMLRAARSVFRYSEIVEPQLPRFP